MATDLLLRIGSDIKGFTDGIGDISGSIEKATSDIEGKFGFLDGLSDKIGGLWGGLALGSVAAAGAAGAALLTIGSDFDSMSDKIRVGTGATGDALASLATSAKTVFAGVPSSMEEVATAITTLTQRTDLAGPALEAVATQALNLSRITGESLEPLLTSTTGAFNAWKLSTDEQGGALDALFTISQNTGASVTTLATETAKLAPVAAQVGLDFNTTAGIIGQFEQSGLNAGAAASGLNIFLKNMAKEGVTDAKGALEGLITNIQSAGSESAGNALAVEAFGKSGIGMAEAIRGGKLEVGELVDKLANSSGAINQASSDTADLAEAFGTFKNSVTVALEPLATGLFNALNDFAIPALQATGTAIKEVIDWFTNWDLSSWTETHFGPFVTAIEPVTSGLQNVWSAVGPLVSAFGEFAGKLAILGIGAVAEHFRQLWNAIEPIASAVTRAASAFAGWALDRFAQFIRDSTGAFNDLIGILNKIPGVASVFDGLKTKVDASASASKDAKEEATKHGDAVKKTGDEHGTAGGKIDTHTGHLGKNKDATKDAKEEQKNLDDALRAFNLTADGSDTKIGKLWAQLNILRDAAKDGKIPMETLEQATKNLHDQIDKADYKAYQDKLKAVGIDAGGPGGAAEKLAAVQSAVDLVKQECDLGIRPWTDYETAVNNAKTAADNIYPPIYSLTGALQNMTTEVNNAKPPLDLLGTSSSETSAFLQGVVMQTQAATTAAVNAAAPTYDLAQHYKTLGIESSTALANKAEAARLAYEAIVNSAAPAVDKMAAYKAAVDAAKLAAEPFKTANVGSLQAILDKGIAVLSGPGSLTDKWDSFQKNAKQWTSELATHAIDKLFNKDKTDSWHAQGLTGIAGVETAFGAFKTNVISSVGGLATDIGDKLFTGKGSWAEIGKDALISLGTAFAGMASKWITEATGLKDSLNGIFSAIKPPNLGSLGGLGGGGGGATTGGTTGPVDTSGITGAVNSGIASIVGAAGSVASAISGIIGNFQNARQENTLNAIEENTRDTESEVRNLRDDEWTRESHNMTKWDDLAQFTWVKLDEIINGIWALSGGVTVSGGSGGIAEAALQSIETSSIGTNDHLAAFRTEVSTGFYNVAVQGDSVITELRTIAGNTEPTPSGAMSVVAPNVEEGLRNINLSTQGVFNGLAPLKDIKDTLGAMRSNIGVVSGIKEAIVGQLGLIYQSMEEVVGSNLKEIARNTYQPYLFYTELNRALIPATTTAGGARPATNISITYQAGGSTANQDAEYRRFADFLARELRRSGV